MRTKKYLKFGNVNVASSLSLGTIHPISISCVFRYYMDGNTLKGNEKNGSMDERCEMLDNQTLVMVDLLARESSSKAAPHS